jgi:hypothetical protein
MKRVLLVCAVALATVLGLVSPAAADTRVFHDATGDTGGRFADITRVVVDNGSVSNRVIVRATVGRLRFGDVSHMWVSTVNSDPGPEYRMTVIPNSDGLWLDRMGDEFWGPVERQIDCPGLRARSDASGGAADDPDVVRFSVPRGCLGSPEAVQVAVRHRYTPVDGPRFDWAPARERFFGAVLAG